MTFVVSPRDLPSAIRKVLPPNTAESGAIPLNTVLMASMAVPPEDIARMLRSARNFEAQARVEFVSAVSMTEAQDVTIGVRRGSEVVASTVYSHTLGDLKRIYSTLALTTPLLITSNWMLGFNLKTLTGVTCYPNKVVLNTRDRNYLLSVPDGTGRKYHDIIVDSQALAVSSDMALLRAPIYLLEMTSERNKALDEPWAPGECEWAKPVHFTAFDVVM